MFGVNMGLRAYVVTRVLLTIPMVLLLLTLVFLIIRVMPGDPVLLHFERRGDEQAMAQMRVRLGLDKPLVNQYFEYLFKLFQGDLGQSMQDYSSVSEQIFSAFPATLELAISSMTIAAVIGVLLGVRSARSYDKPIDHAIRTFGIVTYAIPVFFLGMIFQLTLGIWLRNIGSPFYFPTGQRISPRTTAPTGLVLSLGSPSDVASPLLWAFALGLFALGLTLFLVFKRRMKMFPRGLLVSLCVFAAVWGIGTAVFWHYASSGGIRITTGLYTIDSLLEGNLEKTAEVLKYLFLPSLSLGLVLCGIFVRITRNNMLETLRSDYVTAAKARGLKDRTVTYTYAFRNAFLPVLTMMGLQFALLLGGAVLTETTFSWPGLGRYIVERINFRDYTAIQGAVVVFGLFVTLVSLAVDLLYAYFDPRIRL
jgi:peptide/nickel transport system permease protein